MTIHYSRGRLQVGGRRKDWSGVWYEPIFEDAPDDLTVPGLAPEMGLYLASHGGPTWDDFGEGQVAWDHLFDPKWFESSNKKERIAMQKNILYDAWRYMKATEPEDIILIEAQLTDGDPRHKALARESMAARKLRTRSAKYRRQSRAARGLPAKSIETDSDSESGYESDDMPPPRRPGPLGPHGGSRGTPNDFLMSGARGNSVNASGNGSRSGRSATDLGTPASQRAVSARSNNLKRKQNDDSEVQRNSRPRTRGSQSGLFCSREQTGSVSGMSGRRNANGELDNEAALNEALRLSVSAGEDGNVWSEIGGLNEHDAEEAAMRNSMAPESDMDI